MKQLYTIFIVVLLVNPIFASTISVENFPDLKVTDINGVHHKINSYLHSGKSIILNFSSTWCRPCWNYQNSGVLEEVWENHGPNGSNDVVIIMIEADQNTCEDCLYGQKNCNDFTYGNWSSSFPMSNLDKENQFIADQFNVTKYPSIFALSAKNKTAEEVGQLDLSGWESWISTNKTVKRIAPKINKLSTSFVSKVETLNQEIIKSAFDQEQIKTNLLEIDWQVFPNPCLDQLNIKCDSDINAPVEVSLHKMNGRMVYRRVFKARFFDITFDMTRIPKGPYFLRIRSEDEMITKKILNIR
ncbi:MAG: T9SS type A sorting domain-containing protein [Saprospiraceae bacterium]|nr:T9SS type A sorting domain-containing protein [Saprospiraceae bacterium]